MSCDIGSPCAQLCIHGLAWLYMLAYGNMPPAKKIVCYTGVGAKKSGIHSDAEFLKATETFRCTSLNCPRDVAGWIEWAGALRNTPAQCKSIVKNNRRIDAASKATARASAAFDACVEDKMCMNAETSGGVKAVARCAAMRCPGPSKRLAACNAKVNKLSQATKSTRAKK